MRANRRELFPSIDSSRCTGCGWCVAACPLHLLSLERTGWKKSSVISDMDACTGCKKCALICPFNVITMLETRTHLAAITPRHATAGPVM